MGYFSEWNNATTHKVRGYNTAEFSHYGVVLENVEVPYGLPGVGSVGDHGDPRGARHRDLCGGQDQGGTEPGDQDAVLCVSMLPQVLSVSVRPHLQRGICVDHGVRNGILLFVVSGAQDAAA